MTLYRTSLTVEVTDPLKLEALAVDYLHHPDQGKTPAEIQELLYEGGVFNIKKTLEFLHNPAPSYSALEVLYKPTVLYNGTTLLQVEVSEHEGE